VLTLSLVVQELALGSMASLAAFALRDLPGGFPSLVAHIAAGFWGIAGVCSLRLGGGAEKEAAVAHFLLAAASLVVARLWLRERHRAALVLLVAILVAGSWALLSGGASLAARVPGHAVPRLPFAASLLTSALLLGAALVTMVLGHWYLIPPPLPFRHLIRGATLFLAACVLRAVAFAVAIVSFATAGNPALRLAASRLFQVDGDVMFFALRVFWGIIGPLVLAILVLRTARLRSNQSATGLLYVSLVFVLIGELLANFLLVQNALPL
jgi:hypothetical protein